MNDIIAITLITIVGIVSMTLVAYFTIKVIINTSKYNDSKR